MNQGARLVCAEVIKNEGDRVREECTSSLLLSFLGFFSSGDSCLSPFSSSSGSSFKNLGARKWSQIVSSSSRVGMPGSEHPLAHCKYLPVPRFGLCMLSLSKEGQSQIIMRCFQTCFCTARTSRSISSVSWYLPCSKWKVARLPADVSVTGCSVPSTIRALRHPRVACACPRGGMSLSARKEQRTERAKHGKRGREKGRKEGKSRREREREKERKRRRDTRATANGVP